MSLGLTVLLAVIEGLTEFLPISSTGHLIIASWILDLPSDDFLRQFLVMIQFGAILSVLFLYGKLFIRSTRIYKLLFVGSLPAGVIGLLLEKKIDALLSSVQVVGYSLFFGGLILIFLDNIFSNNQSKSDLSKVSFIDSLKVGCFQCLALVPGVSRSASTIFGGLSVGWDRKLAAEYSFLLALPILSGAAVVKGYRLFPHVQSDQIKLILVGNIVSFIVAALAIKGFVSYISRNSFRAFGFYRVIVGCLVLWFSRNH